MEKSKLGRSVFLDNFITSLGIDKSTEIYSINHPTEDTDRRDFSYKDFRICVQIEKGVISYYFLYERFLATSLNGVTVRSFTKFHNFNNFNQDLLYFSQQIERYNRITWMDKLEEFIHDIKLFFSYTHKAK